MSKRTTVVVDQHWVKAVRKAAGQDLTISQVVRALVRAYAEGKVDVEIGVSQIGKVLVQGQEGRPVVDPVGDGGSAGEVK